MQKLTEFLSVPKTRLAKVMAVYDLKADSDFDALIALRSAFDKAGYPPETATKARIGQGPLKELASKVADEVGGSSRTINAFLKRLFPEDIGTVAASTSRQSKTTEATSPHLSSAPVKWWLTSKPHVPQTKVAKSTLVKDEVDAAVKAKGRRTKQSPEIGGDTGDTNSNIERPDVTALDPNKPINWWTTKRAPKTTPVKKPKSVRTPRKNLSAQSDEELSSLEQKPKGAVAPTPDVAPDATPNTTANTTAPFDGADETVTTRIDGTAPDEILVDDAGSEEPGAPLPQEDPPSKPNMFTGDKPLGQFSAVDQEITAMLIRNDILDRDQLRERSLRGPFGLVASKGEVARFQSRMKQLKLNHEVHSGKYFKQSAQRDAEIPDPSVPTTLPTAPEVKPSRDMANMRRPTIEQARQEYTNFAAVNLDLLSRRQKSALGNLVKKTRESGSDTSMPLREIIQRIADELNGPKKIGNGFRRQDAKALSSIAAIRGDWGQLTVQEGFVRRFDEVASYLDGERSTKLDGPMPTKAPGCKS